ncbi:MAG TPA: DNA-processing protein DprA [Saprospiraceae bacterium]|nr:DNA-processing protein DprA [Saprospiraceae bacterium]
MKTRKTKIYEIAITMIPLVGPVIARQLLSFCGSTEAIFTEQKRMLKSIPGIGEEIASSITNSHAALTAAEEELEILEKENIQYTFYHDANYPSRLRHLPDAPLLLFTKGNVDLNSERCVSIVGTRKPTLYGKSVTEEIIETLAPYDVTIVSGLAYGIDITAHKQSLKYDIPTIGVMGSGMGNIYPDSHQNVAEKMMVNGGLITEFNYHTGPDAVNFPMRNRIVAGMCDILIVIESAVKGGSMITAVLANDYNKDVGAVPGRKIDKTSAGCNHLIRNQQAHLIECGEDLINLMSWNTKTKQQTYQGDLFVEMNESEKKIYSLILDCGEKDIDTLAYESKSTPGELAAVLLNLEFKGAIKSLPGKKYAALG